MESKSAEIEDYASVAPEIEEREEEKEEKRGNGLNSYRNIIKGSSFFGGVQVFNILVTLLRGKFVAIILGPEGMGISALFNSASNTIQRFSSLGLNQSIVRDVANEDSTDEERNSVIRTSLRLTGLTGILGLIVCVAFCIPLSRVTFGDTQYWWQFIMLGAGVYFAVAGNGKLAVLQGLHKVKKISKASIIGGLTGLCIGIPFYYLFGYKGIVPSIVAIFFSLYLFYSISLRKSLPVDFKQDTWRENIPIAKNLIMLGLVLMSGDVILTFVGYLINMYVRMEGSVDDVGLYQAANSVTSQYSGVIFAALAMDYYPRLSSVANDNKKLRDTVNRQSEIVSWLITPAMVLLILTTPLLIRILLTSEFHTIIPLMRWMGIGIMLRAFSFPMAYITFAKGNKKVFFILEGLVASSLTLVLSCLFFHWFGLIGLGYALVADNGLCLILYYFVNKRLYGYNFSRKSVINYLAGGLLAGGCFVFSFITSPGLSYSLMGVVAAMAMAWSFLSLKKHFKKDEN